MMEKQWELTPDAANFLWPKLTSAEAPPYPLRVVDTPRTLDERDLLQRELATRYPVQYLPGQHLGYLREDSPLSTAMGMFGDADVRLTFTSGPPAIPADGGLIPADPDFRAIAATKGDQAALAAQTPDTGQLRLWLCGRDTIERHLINVLPPLTAGPGATLAADRDLVDGSASYTGRRDRPQPAEIIAGLTSAPRSAEGIITIETQLDEPDMKPPTRYLNWIDIDGRGGYLVDIAHQVTVWPASTATLAAEVGRAINRHIRESDPNRSWLH